MKRFFTANKPSVVVAVIIFLTLCVLGLLNEAEAAEHETRLGAGVGIIHAELGGSMSASWSEIFDEKWAVDMFFVGEQTWDAAKARGEAPLRNNFGIGFSRRITFGDQGNYEFTFGTLYWQNTNTVLGCKMTAHLGVSRKLGENWRISYDHFSNGGSCWPNSGQDSVQFQRGFKFGQ